MSITIRVGLPLPGGALPRAARDNGMPVMVSANSLAVRDGDGGFIRFREQLPDLEGLDVALDSAGFVAWAKYGRYHWSVEGYVALAARGPWRWWSQMDACCEPEVARSRSRVRMRQAETLRLLAQCRRAAEQLGASPPVPVLQGWSVADYVWHAEQLMLNGEQLVGVGSMCRRRLTGPDSISEVVAALDGVLPEGVGLHLFGVKSGALRLVGGLQRVVSVDSMAWDFSARMEAMRRGISNNMQHRIEHMIAWYERQKAEQLGGRLQQVLMLDAGEQLGDGVLDWADLVAAGEIEAGSALLHMARGCEL